jgi:hypothetical protein
MLYNALDRQVNVTGFIQSKCRANQSVSLSTYRNYYIIYFFLNEHADLDRIAHLFLTKSYGAGFLITQLVGNFAPQGIGLKNHQARTLNLST